MVHAKQVFNVYTLEAGGYMAMRVLFGWTKSLVDFVNLSIKQKDKYVQLSQAFRETTAVSLQNDPECQNVEALLKLQRRFKRYLTVIAWPEMRGKPRIAPTRLSDILQVVENYGEEEGFSYSLRIISVKDKKLFRSLNQVKILKWGKQKVRVAKFPHYKSLRQYLFTCLAESLESGEISRIGRCRYKECEKFFVAEKTGRKEYCDVQCRWKHNNRDTLRRRKNRHSRLAKIKEKEIMDKKNNKAILQEFKQDFERR